MNDYLKKNVKYKVAHRNYGFTLVEIIVVLIIVAILSSIALPNLYKNVYRQRAHEALSAISTYRTSMEGCIVKEAGTSDTWCNSQDLGLPVQTANFSYSVGAPTGATDTSYMVTATGINALSGTDTLVMSRTAAVFPAVGTVSCAGSGELLGAC